MIKILFKIIFLFLFVFLTNSLIYAERECSRTVSCSDGTTIIDTSCSSSFTIIDGHVVGNDSNDIDDPEHGYHHDDNYDDPCRFGHGHRVDNGSENSDETDVSNETNVSDDTTPPDDPYNLKRGHLRNYDPNDPYGLKQSIN
jgi:hypothetical protein